MPLVQVYRDKSKIGDELLLQLRDVIPQAVASRLASDEGNAIPKYEYTLTKDDISVVFHDFGQFDVRECPLEIIVFANHFPNRARALDERARLIARDLHEGVYGLPARNFFVYILLGTGGFFKAQCTEEKQ